MKNKIKLNETQLHNLIKNSIYNILNEKFNGVTLPNHNVETPHGEGSAHEYFNSNVDDKGREINGCRFDGDQLYDIGNNQFSVGKRGLKKQEARGHQTTFGQSDDITKNKIKQNKQRMLAARNGGWDATNYKNPVYEAKIKNIIRNSIYNILNEATRYSDVQNSLFNPNAEQNQNGLRGLVSK